ncbi:COQ9 family protein [Limibaculum sp. M0105]|uniref:COQ9 family protein n=1 Tax=Thermohalobaculum xanthum TaxID=2753746 RepID=A0A8J7M9Q8_9RHOB|nr:COQ9 family protein [Thermohalobaculum xanthum]MBK0400763.1 COQ9 family protein [Thermohalobaculum xanthum]
MEIAPKTESDHIAAAREQLLLAALPHVAFDGWSHRTLECAIADSGVDRGLAALAFPRGGVDMALGFHELMDRRLADELAQVDLASMKVRERITFAVRRRIEIVADHRDAVRRGATLLALPHHAGDSAAAIWGTADLVWRLCGDTSTDYNWYSKRAILASVYSATVLYWLGDESTGAQNTWGFLDRRIEDVMRFEKFKAQAQANPVARAAFWLPGQLLGMIRAPRNASRGGA